MQYNWDEAVSVWHSDCIEEHCAWFMNRFHNNFSSNETNQNNSNHFNFKRCSASRDVFLIWNNVSNRVISHFNLLAAACKIWHFLVTEAGFMVFERYWKWASIETSWNCIREWNRRISEARIKHKNKNIFWRVREHYVERIEKWTQSAFLWGREGRKCAKDVSWMHLLHIR